MNQAATWSVTYTTFAGEQKDTTVEVKMAGAHFYAQNLQVFGCGKNAISPIWAIKNLVNDHGTFVSATPIEPGMGHFKVKLMMSDLSEKEVKVWEHSSLAAQVAAERANAGSVAVGWEWA